MQDFIIQQYLLYSNTEYNCYAQSVRGMLVLLFMAMDTSYKLKKNMCTHA